MKSDACLTSHPGLFVASSGISPFTELLQCLQNALKSNKVSCSIFQSMSHWSPESELTPRLLYWTLKLGHMAQGKRHEPSEGSLWESSVIHRTAPKRLSLSSSPPEAWGSIFLQFCKSLSILCTSFFFGWSPDRELPSFFSWKDSTLRTLWLGLRGGRFPCDPGFGLTLGLIGMMPSTLSKREETQWRPQGESLVSGCNVCGKFGK